MKFDLYDGKYTYLINEDGSNQRALRHGEPWRDLVGDGFVLAMAHEINEKDKRIAELESKQVIRDLEQQVKAYARAEYMCPDSIRRKVNELREQIKGGDA